MVIVVVGAMIYMFQTFGGTGDKIEGVAQKSSIITEINNIKDGLKIAARSGHIGNGTNDPADAVTNLKGLATLSYFAEQINDQLTDTTNNAANANIYNAISFGGEVVSGATNDSAMKISLISNVQGAIPGIYVDLSAGSLKDNVAFLEAQIATDLSAVAVIQRKANSTTAGELPTTGTDAEKRIPTAPTAGTDIDGKFAIYFKDFGSSEVVQ
jgi:hypothetical protein